MAEQKKKRKVDSECRKFQTRWENEYFFAEVKGKCVCLICNETVAVIKKYNVQRHFETKHKKYESCTGAEREQKGKWELPYKLKKSALNATAASYKVVLLITQHGKLFMDGSL